MFAAKWYVSGAFALVLVVALVAWFTRDEMSEWVDNTWTFARQILPLLFAGVLVAGFLLGSPEGGQGVIPDAWVAKMVGGNSLWANLFASVAGPALSLPNMLVIRSVLGTQKTAVFVALVVALSTVAGLIYGALF